jgi:hypothetical protein
MTRQELPSDPLRWLRESADVAPPEGAQARVAARLASLALPAAAVVAPSGRAAPPPAAPESGTYKMLAERFVRWSLIPLGVGVGLGVGIDATRGGEHLVSRPVAAPAMTSASTAGEPLPSARVVVDDAAATATASVSVPAPLKSSLAAERDLLDRARSQLASGKPQVALGALEQHAKRFPRGQLSEEREAMWVNVLALVGRAEDARAKGEAFARRFPNSLMGSSVQAAMRSAEQAK